MKKLHNKHPHFRISATCAAVLLATAMQAAHANPTGASVVNGQASFDTSGNTLTVTNTPGTIINWQGFSIGTNEITRFAQQSAASTVLNRVVSSDPSSILGSLQSNGRVFLVNPNGIIFGAGATVDVAGLVATTLNISNADFLAGRNNFTAVPGAQNISNAGNLTAQSGGQIYLIAPNVENTGVITAPNGEILLAAGYSVELVDTSNPNLRVNITAPAGDATNVGQLVASSGSLGLFGTMVRSSGTVNADSATLQGGKIVFKASQRVEVSGTVSADATAPSPSASLLPLPLAGEGQGRGGEIQVLGNQVGIMDGATLSANGTQGGGTILIGGDYQGKNPDVPNANVTYVAPTAQVSADATDNGDGGKIIVWADDTTRAYGNISARGGVNGGNGGFVETSGHRYLDVAGIKVSTSALNGTTGNWLLDPTDITIVHSGIPGSAVFTGGPPAVFDSGGSAVTLNDYDINANLASNDITVFASGGNDINFDASAGAGGAIFITNSSGGSRTLILAARDITFNGGTTTFQSTTVGSIFGVNFQPGAGRKINVKSSGGAVVFNGLDGTSFVAGYMGGASTGVTWENDGVVTLSGVSYIDLNASSTFSTFNNNLGGVLNLDSSQGWAIQSTSGAQADPINNAGTVNVTTGTAIEAAYSQSSTGILNVANTKFVNLQNANVLSGTFNIGSGATLSLPEVHSGARTFSGATINDAGTLSFSAPGITFANTNLVYTGGSGDFTIPTGITYSGNIGYSAAGNLTVGTNILASGNISLTAGSALSIADARVEAGGNMTVNAGGDLTLTAGTSQALLKSGGTQTINFTGTGAHTLTLQGSNSNVAGASASIESGGLQKITNAGTLDINLTGGSGTSDTLDATTDNGAVTVCTSCATFNSARIQSDGGQTINASTITLLGGSGGNGNHASIENKSTSVAQNITTTGLISITGGTGVGYFNVNDSVSNDASIHSDATQTINAGSIALIGGGDATTLGGAFLTGKLGQTITTTGNLTMTGGASNSTIDTQYGLGAPAIIGEEFGANITLNIGGAMTMTGGSGSTSGALIGSAQGSPTISITAASIAMNNGTGSHSRIGVLTGGPAGTLSMTASGAITQGTSSYINTASLTAIVTAGALNLAGPNKVNTVNSLSAYSNVNYVSAQGVHIGSAISTTGGNVTLSTTGAGNNLYLGTASGVIVNATSAGGIYDDNGSGVTNITASTSSTLISTGATLGNLGVSADVSTPSITATVSGSYGGIRIGSTGASAPTSIALTDSATVTPQGVSFYHYGANPLVLGAGTSFLAGSGALTIGSVGGLTITGGSPTFVSGSLSLAAGGTLDISALTTNTGSVTLIAPIVYVHGGNSVSGMVVSQNSDVNVVAGTLNLGNNDFTALVGTNISVSAQTLDMKTGGMFASNNIGISANSIIADNVSWIDAGNNVTASVAGDFRLNNSSMITAINDVDLTFAGSTSTLYLNDTAGMANASYILAAPTTTTLDFLARSSGGVVIDGVEKTSTAVGGSGFFAGNTSTPATLGAGLVINYSGASSVVNGLVNDVVGALSGIVLGTTDTTIGAEEKKKEEVVVVADGSAPPVDDTSTASLPVCK
jgi:filamentous hemagglutinin family protein